MKLTRRIILSLACVMLAGCSGVKPSAPVPLLAMAPASLDGDPRVQVIELPIAGLPAECAAKAVVVLPQHYLDEPAARFRTVYLLHGFGGTCQRFYKACIQLDRPPKGLADRFGLILVFADGQRGSWYMDAPADAIDSAQWQLETRLTRHLLPEIDRRYRTVAEPAARGVCGTSMGGHGALYLAARHPDLFGACGSIAGICQLSDTTNPAEMAKRLGPLEQQRARWIEHSVLTQCDKFAGRSTAILMDIGQDDPFFMDNRAVHDKLSRLGVPHDYFERPGGHTGAFWSNALPYHLQFMADHLKPTP